MLLLVGCTPQDGWCAEYNQSLVDDNWEIQLKHWDKADCELWCEQVYRSQECVGEYKWEKSEDGCDCLINGCKNLEVFS